MTESLRESHLGPYRVEAFNASKESEKKIRDDAVARRFGSRGGLVPGVDVDAYMTHLPVQRWGRVWLERGTAECRFLKPVYDGDTGVVTAVEGAAGLDLRIDSHGELCVTGRAALTPERVAPPPTFAEAPGPRGERPPAGEATLAIGPRFALNPISVPDQYAYEFPPT